MKDYIRYLLDPYDSFRELTLSALLGCRRRRLIQRKFEDEVDEIYIPHGTTCRVSRFNGELSVTLKYKGRHCISRFNFPTNAGGELIDDL